MIVRVFVCVNASVLCAFMCECIRVVVYVRAWIFVCLCADVCVCLCVHV